MNSTGTFEKYPSWIVLISNLQSFTLYFLGFLILFQFNLLFAIAYLLFVLFLEFRIIRNHCVDCYYYGKICGFGKGKISSLFFQKGNPEKFCSVKMTWVSMVPEMLVFLIPVITGIVLLIIDFNFLILLFIILILILSTAGNGFVRGSLTCKYCKQKELGCPAEKLFNKGEKAL